MFSGSQQPPLSCPRSNVPSDTNLPVSPLSLHVSCQRFPYLSPWCWNILSRQQRCLSPLNQGTVGLSPHSWAAGWCWWYPSLTHFWPPQGQPICNWQQSGSCNNVLVGFSNIFSRGRGAGEILGVTCGHHENGLFMIGAGETWKMNICFLPPLMCLISQRGVTPQPRHLWPLSSDQANGNQCSELESAQTGCCSAWVQLPCHLIQLFSVRKNLPDALHHYYQ